MTTNETTRTTVEIQYGGKGRTQSELFSFELGLRWLPNVELLVVKIGFVGSTSSMEVFKAVVTSCLLIV